MQHALLCCPELVLGVVYKISSMLSVRWSGVSLNETMSNAFEAHQLTMSTV